MRSKRDDDIRNVDVDVEIRYETGMALLVSDGDRAVWVPKSQLVGFDDTELIWDGKTITLTMPEWLAKEKGLIW